MKTNTNHCASLMLPARAKLHL